MKSYLSHMLSLMVAAAAIIAAAEASAETTVPKVSEVIAAAMKDPAVIPAVVRLFDVKNIGSEKTVFSFPIQLNDNSLGFFADNMPLTLLQVEELVSTRSRLPTVVHVVGVQSLPTIVTDISTEPKIIAGAALPPGQQSIVFLKRLKDLSAFPDAKRHLERYAKKGIKFYTLYNGGKAAYALIRGRKSKTVNSTTQLPKRLVSDLRRLAKKIRRLRLSGKRRLKRLRRSLVTETGREVVDLLVSAAPLPDFEAEDQSMRKQLTARGQEVGPRSALITPPTTERLMKAGTTLQCPRSHEDQTHFCVPGLGPTPKP